MNFTDFINFFTYKSCTKGDLIHQQFLFKKKLSKLAFQEISVCNLCCASWNLIGYLKKNRV